MKVKDLIERLQKCDLEATIHIEYSYYLGEPGWSGRCQEMGDIVEIEENNCGNIINDVALKTYKGHRF